MSFETLGIEVKGHSVRRLFNHISGVQVIFTKRSKIFCIGYRTSQSGKFIIKPISKDRKIAASMFDFIVYKGTNTIGVPFNEH